MAFDFRELATGRTMFRREGDENVRDTSLSVPLGVEVPCGRGGRGWDVRAEKSVRFGVSDDSTVVDDHNCGVQNSI